MRIIWLFGPPGVGKSVTAWEVLNVLSDRDGSTAYVDIDQLGMAAPDTDDDGEAHRHKTWALAAAAQVHAHRGVSTLVVSGVLDPDQVDFSRRALADLDLELVRLAADVGVLRQRMAARGEYAEDWAGVMADAQRHDAADHGLPVVRTDEDEPSQVARRVIDAARTPPDAPLLPRANEPPGASGAGLGRAVLITGCRAVGKSTVGWQVFMLARELGIPTAFLDLRQLGFHGRDGGPTDHALQASATGALWRVFRERGNTLLLLNGTTTEPGQAQLYADHLDATPLTTVRLTADVSELTARARARARGEMAPLAGDDIIGADDERLELIVHEARLAQESCVAADEVVVDTSDLSAAEAARTVVDLVRIDSHAD